MAIIEKDYGYVTFEWHDEKEQKNIAKHKLSFETAHLAFFDPNALTAPHQVVDGEERWRTLARIGDTFVILFIGHLYDTDEDKEYIKIITARQATNEEQREYYDNQNY